MAIQRIEHDDMFFGDGTLNSPLGLTDEGLRYIYENKDRQFFKTSQTFLNIHSGLSTIDYAYFENPSNLTMRPLDWAVDSAGQLALILQIEEDEEDESKKWVFVETFIANVIRPTGWTWTNLRGDVMDNSGFRDIYGDKKIFKDKVGDDYVQAINKLRIAWGEGRL